MEESSSSFLEMTLELTGSLCYKVGLVDYQPQLRSWILYVYFLGRGGFPVGNPLARKPWLSWAQLIGLLSLSMMSDD